MSWQDVVLTFGNLIFAYALIPSIKSKDKPHISTSLMTGTVLVIFSVTFLTLGLHVSAAMVLLTAVLWLTFAVQKYRQIQLVKYEKK